MKKIAPFLQPKELGLIRVELSLTLVKLEKYDPPQFCAIDSEGNQHGPSYATVEELFTELKERTHQPADTSIVVGNPFLVSKELL